MSINEKNNLFLFFCIFLIFCKFQASAFRAITHPHQKFLLSHFSNRGFKEFTNSDAIEKLKIKNKNLNNDSWKYFHYTGKLRKGRVTPASYVPNTIRRPPYVWLGDSYFTLKPPSNPPLVKSIEDIDGVRAASSIARYVLDEVGRSVHPGVTTDELDKIAHAKCLQMNGYPSTLHYRGFPKSLCTSINEVLCHGIPDSTVLMNGDVITVDFTCYYKGYHGDCAETYLVGTVDDAGKQLTKATHDIWKLALQCCKGGEKLSRIGNVIAEAAERRGVTSLNDFCGHGIGRMFHEEPQIMHTKNNMAGEMLPGMIFTVEPVICEGSSEYCHWPDEWTVATTDGKRCAQFEDTILITEDGYEALTGKNEESPNYFWEQSDISDL